MYKPLITAILCDAGFKDSSPALLSLKNQTMLKEMQVIWIDFYDKTLKTVDSFSFIEKVTLNMKNEKMNMAYCYNKGLELAKGEYFIIIDPCLWFQPDMIEFIYKFHKKNPNFFTYNRELRGRDRELRFYLEKKYPSMLQLEKSDKVIRNGNYGCLSCSLTKNFIDVNGFDIFDVPLNDACVSLCYDRIKNNTNCKLKMLEKNVFHAWHPNERTRCDNHILNLISEREKIVKLKGITITERGLNKIKCLKKH